MEYWAYRLLFATGPLGQATKASRCLLPVGPFLLHLFLIQVLHDFALSRFQRRGNGRLNVNKITFPLVRHSQLLLPRSAVNLPGRAPRCVELCAGERDVNPDSVTVWWEVRMGCTPFSDNMNNRSIISNILTHGLQRFGAETLICATLSLI